MTDDAKLQATLDRLSLLTAMNTLMLQSQFLTVERLRISSQVVDENISNEFGTRLFEACEKLVGASDAELEEVLRTPGLFKGREAEREAVLQLLEMRRDFAQKLKEIKQKKREGESMERMYR